MTMPMPPLSIPSSLASSIATKLRRPTTTKTSSSFSQSARDKAQVIYGGAHLFSAEAPAKLAARASTVMASFGSPDPVAFASLFAVIGDSDSDDLAFAKLLTARVEAKLAADPIEAMCIDFEDGFGPRSDDEEDREAIRAATELAKMTMQSQKTQIGIRIKALEGDSLHRAMRTLDLFVTTLGRPSEEHFSVTLPKVSRTEEVEALVTLLEHLEARLSLTKPIAIELMIETPEALLHPLPLIEAGRGRVKAVHLGAYDLTASLGITAGEQRLDHPVNDLARILLKLTLASTTVTVVDGATTLLPIAPKNASNDEARGAIHKAWRLHGANVRRAIEVGIFQGWDLHPHQLPARYGAMFSHFFSQKDAMAERLKNFVERGVQASRVGQVFDDAATGNGLMTFFRRGLACGAFDASDLSATTLSPSDLSRSFAEILASR